MKAENAFASNRMDGDSSFDREGGLESDGIVEVVEINITKRSREIKGGSSGTLFEAFSLWGNAKRCEQE